MKGRAISHGAGTIVNAISTGKGAAFGVDLKTWAEVTVNSTGRIEVTIEDYPGEDISLVHRCVSEVLDRYAPGEMLGAKVITRSEIPVSKGLKSSSAAANAAVFATLDAMDVEIDTVEGIRIGTECARRSGVSLTGAFDDACASWLGGAVITDNAHENILKRTRIPKSYRLVLHVPDFQIRKKDVPVERMKAMGEMVDHCFSLALGKDYLKAMTLNGLVYSAALGLDPAVSVTAMQKGAMGAGLSGTGPATAIIVDEGHLDDFLSGFDDTEHIIVADFYLGEDRS
jgi:shikimate kinase